MELNTARFKWECIPYPQLYGSKMVPGEDRNSDAQAREKDAEIGMKWNSLEEEQCSVARTVSVIGDRWTLLVLRDCFLRVRRFEDFQARLEVTRHVLADRLRKLVRHGVLRRVPYQPRPKRYEYILTQKGLDLYPIIMAIVHWGDVHMVDERGRPRLYEHRLCGKMFDPVMTCSECGQPLSPKEVHVHIGPGANESDRLPARTDALERAADGAK
jgi:DNA-binding HxlR family transcriptional regulator